jgi:L-asparaginase
MGTLEQLPRVEIITSHADADGALVDALLAAWPASDPQRLRGLVVACTGHGTWHRGLEPALLRARRAGVVVWRSSRVARGGVESKPGDTWPVAGRLTPAQARVALAITLALRDLG